MNSKTIFAFIFLAMFYLVRCSQGRKSSDLVQEESKFKPDLLAAASGHHGGGGNDGHGRVQIKVYRGPSEGHDKFAPHGYWVKQPADHHH